MSGFRRAPDFRLRIPARRRVVYGRSGAAAERADGKYVMFIPMADATPSANPAEHDEPAAHLYLRLAASMPRAGEFIIAVWEGTWLNPNLRLKFYHATAHHSDPVWGGSLSTVQRKARLTR